MTPFAARKSPNGFGTLPIDLKLNLRCAKLGKPDDTVSEFEILDQNID